MRQKEEQLEAGARHVEDIKNKVHQQKALYEAVRTDKNIYSKNLVEV